MEKNEVTAAWGGIVGAILKYSQTRISMRDALGELLEEENELLKKKVALLFKNLTDYEEIIEEEFLGNLTQDVVDQEPSTDTLAKLFAASVEEVPQSDLNKNKFSGGIWDSKTRAASELLDRKRISTQEKKDILELAFADSDTPEEFLTSVVRCANKLPAAVLEELDEDGLDCTAMAEELESDVQDAQDAFEKAMRSSKSW
jgi:hypothetical protein